MPALRRKPNVNAGAEAGLQLSEVGVSAEERQQMIAAAAYRRYEQRAGESNDPVADWVEAEKEVDATLAGEESTKSAFMRWVATLLSECQTQLEQLGNDADVATAAMKTRYEAHLAVLNSKYDEARGKLVEIRENADDAWGQFREGAEKAVTELRTAVQEAVATLRR